MAGKDIYVPIDPGGEMATPLLLGAPPPARPTATRGRGGARRPRRFFAGTPLQIRHDADVLFVSRESRRRTSAQAKNTDPATCVQQRSWCGREAAPTGLLRASSMQNKLAISLHST